MKRLYSASVTTKAARGGHVQSEDGILNLNLSVPKSLGGEGGAGTNPEQLFGAAYSACFGSALEAVAKQHDVSLGDYAVTATISLGKTEEDQLQLSAVLDCYLPGVDTSMGETLVNEAHVMCPYSRATRDNIDVTLNLLLDE